MVRHFNRGSGVFFLLRGLSCIGLAPVVPSSPVYSVDIDGVMRCALARAKRNSHQVRQSLKRLFRLAFLLHELLLTLRVSG